APSKRVKRVTGLKIGGSQLAAARVHNNGVPELVQVAREALDPGVVVGGELRDPDALAAALKGFFKRHKLPRQGVRLGIANNRIGIDLEAFALLRAITEPLAAEAGPASAANVVVAVGHDRSTFAVSDGRVCEFTRVLDWGGATLNVAIARELDIAPSEAEPVKRSLSLTHGDTPEGLTDDQANRAREAIRRQLQSFARELVSSLQFYQNQPDSLGIGEIVLTGGTVHLRGLAEELQTLIGVNVRPGDPLARVKVGKKIKDAEQIGSLAIAIGLGIED